MPNNGMRCNVTAMPRHHHRRHRRRLRLLRPLPPPLPLSSRPCAQRRHAPPPTKKIHNQTSPLLPLPPLPQILNQTPPSPSPPHNQTLLLISLSGSVHLTSNSSSCSSITRADIAVLDAAADDRWSAGQLFSMHQRGHMPSNDAVEANKPPLTLKMGSYPSSQELVSSVAWVVLHNLQPDKPDVPSTVIAVGESGSCGG